GACDPRWPGGCRRAGRRHELLGQHLRFRHPDGGRVHRRRYGRIHVGPAVLCRRRIGHDRRGPYPRLLEAVGAQGRTAVHREGSVGMTRIGMIVPSSNTSLEPATTRLLANRPDVTIHYTRIPVRAITLDGTGAAFDADTMV